MSGKYREITQGIIRALNLSDGEITSVRGVPCSGHILIARHKGYGWS